MIGHWGKSKDDVVPQKSNPDGVSEDMLKIAMEDIDPNRIREYLKELTKEPHVAGLRRDIELTHWIKETWENDGLDHVNLYEYNFYLSWPNQSHPNKIYLLDDVGQVKFTSQHKEEELRKGDDHPDFVHGFNAFSPAADVEGALVYVNYARVEDVRELEGLLGEDFLMGKICIARYGKIFRGNKVKNCQDRGAKGVHSLL